MNFLSAMREAVMYHEKNIRKMLPLYPLIDNINGMVMIVHMEIAELSLNLFVTSKVKEKKYLSVKVEQKTRNGRQHFFQGNV